MSIALDYCLIGFYTHNLYLLPNLDNINAYAIMAEAQFSNKAGVKRARARTNFFQSACSPSLTLVAASLETCLVPCGYLRHVCAHGPSAGIRARVDGCTQDPCQSVKHGHTGLLNGASQSRRHGSPGRQSCSPDTPHTVTHVLGVGSCSIGVQDNEYLVSTP